MSEQVQVVIYGCLSDRAEDEQSIPSQVAKVRERLAQVYPDGYEIVGVFTDDGVSGSKRNRGPGLQAAIDAATHAADEPGRAELWANTSARFARGKGKKETARSLLQLYSDMERAGVALRSVHDDDMLREELVGIASRMAAKYSEDLSESVKRAKRRQAVRGEHLGGPLPDGYVRADEGETVIDRDREPVVREVLGMGLDGVPDAQIARSLNVKGIPTRQGNPWTRRAVQDLLTRPFYAGLIEYEGEFFEGRHEAYIEPADWQRMVAARGERDHGKGKHTGGRPARLHALQGLAICGSCGRRMNSYTSSHERVDETRRRAYRCPSYTESNGSCPGAYVAEAGAVDAALLADLDRLLPDFEKWIAQVTKRRAGERERLMEIRDRCQADHDAQAVKTAKVEAKWSEYLVEDEAKADLVLPMVERERQALADSEKRLRAAQDALDTTPVETPTDAFLDFANALQGALTGIDTSGSMAQVNTELARVFEAFVIWVDEGVVRINPMLRTSVAEALVHQSFSHHGSSMPLDNVWEIEPDQAAPPLRWLSCPPETEWNSQEYLWTKPKREAFAASHPWAAGGPRSSSVA
jgi:DNA invertase Pin-like site-specific DNA recombinase